MANHQFNKAHFEIQFSGLKKDGIYVLSFEGTEKISDLFEYRVKIVSDDPALDSSKVLNKEATFILNRGDSDPVKIFGIISQFRQFGRTPDYVFYEAVLVPHFWRSKLMFQNQVYQDKDIKEIIEAVLSNSGITGQSLKIDLKNQYPKVEYLVQYRETDFDFLNRRCEHYGIFYYFDHSSEKDVIVFTDSNSKIQSIATSDPVGYNQNRDMLGSRESVFEINCIEKVVTGSVQVKDYNYLFPEKQLMAQSQINSNHPGMFYDFGDNFQNEKEAEHIAKIRNQEFLAQSKIFYGTGDCRLFRTGYKYKMEKHYRDDWNNEYILTELRSRGTQQPLFAFLPQPKKIEPTYENWFEAIPFDIEFKPARRTPIPKVNGVMSAKIESGSNDQYAFIDDHGRYKAKMLFDLSDKTNGEATMPLRLSQNYSGSGYGVHFPNHPGSELLWACVDGDVDRPVGLGTIPNPSTATPVKSGNKSQNVIRTASGNEIILEDKKDETRVYLASADLNTFSMDDKDNKIELVTKDKHRILMDDMNKNITVKTFDEHRIILDDKNKKIQIITNKDHFIEIDNDAEKIQLSDKNEKNRLIIDIANDKIVIETVDGNMELKAPNGDLKIDVKTLTMEVQGNTSLKSGKIKAEGDEIKIEGKKITQQSQTDLILKGKSVTSEATGEHKSKGMNLTVEASINTKVKGAMVTVESSGPNTIKGMPVQIN